MSNTTCRPHGIAKRALALLTAIALATALIPSFAFAGEVNNVAATTAEQSQATESANSSSAVNDAASRAETTAPDANGAQTSSSSNTAEDATASRPKATVGEATNPNSGEPANQASSTQAETVSAALKVSVYGTTLVSHTFAIEKGKTVKDLLDLAASQGYIGAIDPEKDLNTYDDGLSHFIKFLTINGNVFGNPVTPNAYWMSSISANGASGQNAAALPCPSGYEEAPRLRKAASAAPSFERRAFRRPGLPAGRCDAGAALPPEIPPGSPSAGPAEPENER